MSFRKKIVGFLFSVVALVPGCSVFGVRDTPEPSYTVEKEVEQAQIEVREYAPMIVAVTRVDTKSYDRASSTGFRRLADYIFGKNARQENIGMTAPVFQGVEKQEGENIGMTAPVFRQKDAKGRWVMSFVMPERYTMETLPRPMTEDIELEQIPARKVAVVRFNGSMSAEQFARKTKELEAWIVANGYVAVSAPRMAGYDPPLTIPFFRRNEVLIVVEERAEERAEGEAATVR